MTWQLLRRGRENGVSYTGWAVAVYSLLDDMRRGCRSKVDGRLDGRASLDWRSWKELRLLKGDMMRGGDGGSDKMRIRNLGRARPCCGSKWLLIIEGQNLGSTQPCCGSKGLLIIEGLCRLKAYS